MIRRRVWCAAFLSVTFLVGCGGETSVPISGTVTWKGEPIPEGDILFVPPEKAGVPDPGKIRDGKFAFRAQPGAKRVRIHASRPKPGIDPVMQAPQREPYIPDCYNAKTVLTAEVKADGPNEFHFDLTPP
jgi:hypothetical protein